MKVGVDLDGTANADPALFHDLLKALRKAGHKVIFLTGCNSCPVTDVDKAMKASELDRLGLGKDYDKLKVFSNPPGKEKAAWCAKHDVALLIDNSMSNAQLAPCGTFVLVPWRTLSS